MTKQTSREVYYWDACVLLAHICGERRSADEEAGLKNIARQVTERKATLVTSVITFTELWRSALTPAHRTTIEKLFLRSNCVVVNVDKRIAVSAAEIRCRCRELGSKLATPDAIHIATAILYQATQMHTFDGTGTAKVNRKLIPLSGSEAVEKLVICPPPRQQQAVIPFEAPRRPSQVTQRETES